MRGIVATLLGARAAEDCVSEWGSGGPRTTALELARLLEAPVAAAQTGGEFEGLDFWQEHESLLERARLELGPRRAYVYAPTASECFRPEIVAALNDTDPGAALRALLEATAMPGVFALPLLRDSFVADLVRELDHLRSSGIPLRRPNGMNRDGCVLSFLGFQDGLLDTIGTVMRRLGLATYPRALRSPDIAELYGFSIRYSVGGDVALAEHADGAALTFNICLGHPGFQGGDLLFRGVRFHDNDAESRPTVAVAHATGVAIMHLGQHLHSATPLHAGVRENLVIWAMGSYGYVRIAPYDDDTSALDRIHIL